MAKIVRFTRVSDDELRAQFSITLNIVLAGSKQMEEHEQDQLMAKEPQTVRVVITDADNPGLVLCDEKAEVRVFSTGSVGYNVRVARASFLGAAPEESES